MRCKSFKQRVLSFIESHTNFLSYLMFFLISLRALVWIDSNKVAMDGDLIFPLVLGQYTHLAFAWDRINLGLPADNISRLLSPSYIFSAAAIILHLNIRTWQIGYMIFSYSGGMICTYKASLMLIGKEHRGSGVLAAIAFATFPYLVSDGVITAISFSGQYFIFALSTYALLEAINRRTITTSILAGFAFVPAISLLPNYAVFLALVGYLLLISLLQIDRRNVKELVKHLLVVFSTTVSITIPFWIGYLEESSFFLSALASATKTTAALSYNADIHLTLINVIRGLGSWPLYSSVGNIPYLAYSSSYLRDPVATTLTFLFPLCAFCAILLCSKERIVRVLIILSIILLFLLQADNGPTGGLFIWMVQHVPLFSAFANPVDYFEPFLGLTYSLLIAFTMRELIGAVSRRTVYRYLRLLFVAVLIMAMLYSSWPLMNGSVNNGFDNNYGVALPSYYQQAASWINGQQGDFRVLILPQLSSYPQFSWGYIGNMFPELISKPIVYGYGFDYEAPPDPILSDLFGMISSENGSSSIAPYLTLMGIKYVLYDSSVIQSNSSSILGRLESDNLLSECDQVGSISIFENTEFQGTFYIPQNLEASSSNATQFPILQSNSTLTAFLEPANLEQLESGNPNATNSTLLLNANSYNDFQLTLQNNGTVLVVFTEYFNTGWNMYVNGVLDTNHIEVNQIMNGWLISTTGRQSVQIQYAPENNLELFYAFSLLVFLILVFFVIRPRSFNTMVRSIKSKVWQFVFIHSILSSRVVVSRDL